MCVHLLFVRLFECSGVVLCVVCLEEFILCM